MAPLPSVRRLRERLLPCSPALVSSPMAIVANASSIDTSTIAPDMCGCAACMPAHAAASPPMNADCSPTGRIGASDRSSTCPVSSRAMPLEYINVRSLAGSFALGPL